VRVRRVVVLRAGHAATLATSVTRCLTNPGNYS
jgi:hypothetical protein